MNKKLKSVPIGKIYSVLKKEVKKFKVPVVDLMHMQTKDPFKVLITTILSARTKDQTTLVCAKRLFGKVRSFSALGKLSQKQIEKLIYPVGFYKTKAKHLKQLPVVLKKEFGGKIPRNVDELVKLPGVGRKTANLVVTVAFQGKAVCVDTHVHKILNRLGYVKTKNPHQTELVLRKKLPKKYWGKINAFLVAFGQNTCTPVSPYCSKCPIRKYCNRIGVKKSR